MLIREFVINNKKDLEDVLDLIEIRLEFGNSKYNHRYVDSIRLITGSRLVFITTVDTEGGRYYMLEMTTYNNIKVHRFDSLIDMDLYCMNRWWININSFNFQDVAIKNRVLYHVLLIRDIIKKNYNKTNRWLNKLFENREDVDLSDVKCYDSPYFRFHSLVKVSEYLLDMSNDIEKSLYKIDDDKFIMSVGDERYIYVVVIDGDVYTSMLSFKLSSSFVNKYVSNLSSILDNVVNKTVDGLYGLSEVYTHTLSVDKYKYCYIVRGDVKFKINKR